MDSKKEATDFVLADFEKGLTKADKLNVANESLSMINRTMLSDALKFSFSVKNGHANMQAAADASLKAMRGIRQDYLDKIKEYEAES